MRPMANDPPILMIEDDDVVAQLVCAVLQKDGVEVLIAPNGYTGLDLFERHRPRIMVLDLAISGPNSIEVLRTVHGSILQNKLSVVCIVMSGEAELEFQARKLGAVEFLYEPFEPADLRSVVRRMNRSAA